jgi:hypothetical protein
LFCCLVLIFSRFFLCLSKAFATRFLVAMPRIMRYICTAEAINGCSSGSPLMLLTVGDSKVPALAMRMAFWTLRVVHGHGVLVLRAPLDNESTAWVMCYVNRGVR